LLPYWLLFVLFAAGSFEYRRRAHIGEQAAPILVAGGILIALVVGLRYEVGGDWYNYLEIYEQIALLDLATALVTQDPGYALLNYVANDLELEIWFVNLICGLIFSWGLIKFARRQPNPWLAVLIAIPYLVIVVAMGYTRQAVAIGLLLAGLASLDRSTMIRFGLYIVLATAFHKSAIVVLPLVGLAAARERIVVAGLVAVLGALLYYFFVEASIDRLVTNYVEAQYAAQGAAIRVAMNVPPALLFLFYRRRFNLNSQQQRLWTNFSVAAVVALFMLLLTEATTALDRLALYLIPLQIFVLSRIPEAFHNNGRANVQIMFLIVIYSALIQFVWLNYAVHAEYWLPYQIYPLLEE
jgi:hypothetical protein